MQNKCNCKFALITGISAAVVALISVGGYFLHKKTTKRRLRNFERRQAMKRVVFGFDDGEDLYGDYDEDGEDEYYEELFKDFDNDGYDNLVNELNREDNDK